MSLDITSLPDRLQRGDEAYRKGQISAFLVVVVDDVVGGGDAESAVVHERMGS